MHLRIKCMKINAPMITRCTGCLWCERIIEIRAPSCIRKTAKFGGETLPKDVDLIIYLHPPKLTLSTALF